MPQTCCASSTPSSRGGAPHTGCNGIVRTPRGRPQFPEAADVAAEMALDLALDTAAAKQSLFGLNFQRAEAAEAEGKNTHLLTL